MPKRRLYDPVVVATTGKAEGRSDVRSTSKNKRRTSGGGDGPVDSNNSGPPDNNNVTAKVGPQHRNSSPKPQTQQPPNSHHPKHPDRPIQQQRPPNKTQRRGSDILLKLSNACQRHSIHHPDRKQPNNKKVRINEMMEEEEIPEVCRKAIHSLRGLMPKLEKAIAPTIGSSVGVNHRSSSRNSRSNRLSHNSADDTVEAAAALDDVLHLCEFYNSVLTGYYCPHMPHLFHLGKDVGTILDKVHYLLGHLLNPALFRTDLVAMSKGESPNDQEPYRNDSSDTNSVSTSLQANVLDSLCHTIAMLLGFVVEDTGNNLHRIIFRDLVYLLEDCAVLESSTLSTLSSSLSSASSSSPSLLPAHLDIFRETTLSGGVHQMGADGHNENHQQTTERTMNPLKQYTLDLHDLVDVHLLQTSVLRILNLYILDVATDRLEDLPKVAITSPSQPSEETGSDVRTRQSAPTCHGPHYFPSGDYDLVLPPGSIHDNEILSSLLVALKPVLLLWPQQCSNPQLLNTAMKRSRMDVEFASFLNVEGKCAATEILIRLVEDWHCCESGPPWCIAESALLVGRAIQVYIRVCGQQYPSKHRTNKVSPPTPQSDSLYDSRLAILVDRVILHPPPSFTMDTASAINTPILLVFLDCLEGIAVRLGQSRLTPTLVDIKILQTIHSVTSSSTDLLAVAVDYSLSKDLLQYLFVLLVSTAPSSKGSTATMQFWTLQLLGDFLRSLMTISYHWNGPSNNEMIINDACWQAWSQHSSSSREGEQHQNPTATDREEKDSSNNSDAGTRDNGTGESVQTSDVSAVGTKRKPRAMSPRSTRQKKQARSPLQPLSLSPTKSRSTVKAIPTGTSPTHVGVSMEQDCNGDGIPKQNVFRCLYPSIWSEALTVFLCQTLDSGRNLQTFLDGMPSSRLDRSAALANEDNDEDMRKHFGGDASHLCWGLRLLLCLSQADTDFSFYQAGKNSVSGISALVQQLVRYLTINCDSLGSRFTAVIVEKEPVYVELADYFLRCGFSIHFLLSSDLPSKDSAERIIYCRFLQSVACLSLSAIQVNPKLIIGFDSPGDICWLCEGIPPYFLRLDDGRLLDGGFCRSHCFNEGTAGALSSKPLAVIDALPLYTKAALFASLNPLSNNPVEDSTTRGHKKSAKFLGQHSLDVFIGCVYNGLGSKCDEMNNKASALHLAAAPLLHLIPLLAAPRNLEQNVSSVLAVRGSLTSCGPTETPRSRVLQFLQTILDSVMEDMKEEKQYVLQSLLAAIGLIQDLATTSKDVPVFGPSALLGIIQCRYRCQSCFRGPQIDENAWLGTHINVLAPKIASTECPRSRYLLWMCLVRYCRTTSPCELRRQLFRSSTAHESATGKDGEISLKNVFFCLLAVPFSDADHNLRNFTSQEIIQLMMTKDYSFLLSCFATDEDFQDYCIYSRREGDDRSEGSTLKLLQASDDVVTGLFREIDRLLDENCGLSGSQLSLTISRPNGRETVKSELNRLSLQYTAASVLSSMCSVADLSHPIGKSIFEKALLRLIRIWAAASLGSGANSTFSDLRYTTGSKALAFAAMASLSQSRDLSLCLSDHRSWTYFPGAVFSDIILLNNTSSREEQFVLLERFLVSFLIGAKDSLAVRRSLDAAIELFEVAFPSLIAQFVIENDDELLRLTCCFRLFIRDTRMNKNNSWLEEPLLIGGPNSAITEGRSSALAMGQKELQVIAKDMCLGIMDEVLPFVLISSDQQEGVPLKFLTRVIAPRTITDVVKSREQRILKGIAWELGAEPYRVGSVLRGMRTAALACLSDEGGGVVRQGMSSGTEAAQAWVTKQFMFLVVNLIQHNWNSRTPLERLQAFRCLFFLLDFLDPVESAQYFPQVLATFNAGISEIGYDLLADIPERMYLRLEATKCLAKFIRLASKSHLATVIDNLTTIVVSLIPVLEDERVHFDKTRKVAIDEARNEAVALLEFLTCGENVRRFRREFSEIPFLPASAALDTVHKNLREHGVDFDNLLILSTSTTASQHGTRRDSLTLDTGSKLHSATRNADKVSALQKRLAMICPLLENESTSVRSVAMQHLADLLRANRESFHFLVDNEGSVSIRNFVTVRFGEGTSGKSEANGNVTDMVERLVRRSTIETDPEVVIRLATCLGEIGAIGEHRLEDVSLFKTGGDESFSLYRWRLERPPWQTRATKYELQLVTKHLVTALKAARSSDEQHKIAFSIQQLLVLLDTAGRQNEKEIGANDINTGKKREMSKWLMNQLVDAKVYETVEPFWLSEFKEKTELHKAKKPPFFMISTSYHIWIATFCRWMIVQSKNCTLSRWKDFFFACRTAVKAPVGQDTAEFLLPLLVADRIYFGSAKEFESLCKEFLDLLDFDSKSSSSPMDHADRQKAVSVFFSTFDTLTFWAERETEDRHRNKRHPTSMSNRGNGRIAEIGSFGCHWPAEETITRIYELAASIPLHVQAKAAASVGMHARALRLLEMADRKEMVEEIFESNSCDAGGLQKTETRYIDIDLLKSILASLDDFETMGSVGDGPFWYNPLLHVTHAIQRKEAAGDFEAALQDYERAIQFQKDNDGSMEKGALQCLLELGRFENVLDRITSDARANRGAIDSFAVEAACRLGRWDTLSTLLERGGRNVLDVRKEPADLYREEIGKVMLCLRDRDAMGANASLQTSRKAAMESLACVARESFSKAYSDIVKLHCIRELEDAATFLCHRVTPNDVSLVEITESTLHDGWAWEGRLRWATLRAASTIMSTRVAIARLGQEPVVEASLCLSIGKHARKHGMRTVAENFFSNAEVRLASIPHSEYVRNPTLEGLVNDVQVEYAKLKNTFGENGTALKLLGQDMVQNAFEKMSEDLENPEYLRLTAVEYERTRILNLFGAFAAKIPNDKVLSERFAKRLLRTTQWTVDGGMKSGSEIIERFRAVHKLSPEWEKGHFHFAQYLNSLVSRRFDKESAEYTEEGSMNSEAICRDKGTQKFILLAIEHYSAALKLDMKHVYQALPRLLSLWFDFVSIHTDNGRGGGTSSDQKINLQTLAENQDLTNQFMAKNLKVIPPAAFYTAIPQLVSRVIHRNNETALIVKKILERVLFKFPLQAMWHLAWLKGSKNSDRSRIGEEIFKEAQTVLIKTKHSDMANILQASGSLFKFLQELARHTGDKASSHLSIRSWKGLVDLTEFLPPVQAALSVSPMKTMKSKKGSRDFFPRVVPRMRAFSSRVAVMSSKARPKKLKAFAVPGTWKHANNVKSDTADGIGSATPLDCDIGEIHFLVKQEAKGDLRKDARVQDLNNVINRLMTSSNQSSNPRSRRTRRLCVRTFAVTCLSEDTGILEWVPQTDSLRNAIIRSYNPQTSPLCPRRRGSRIANFGDATLRTSFERCQNMFYKNGDIVQAAKLFDTICLKSYPPVLYWWFVQNFHDPHSWYEARLRFTLSAAAWSAIGHVIGLGDRHSENILMDTLTGGLLHVDFDCIFDKGLNLPRPEVVPFRLTPNMVDAFGPAGSDGMFTTGMRSCMGILRDNRDTLLSVLEPFVKDPVIDWKRHRSQQPTQTSTGTSNTTKTSASEAKRSIQIIKERLSGIYNVRNPNLRTYRHIIVSTRQHDEDDETMMAEIPLSIEGQVKKLIVEASKNENLVQLYVGWMPWA